MSELTADKLNIAIYTCEKKAIPATTRLGTACNTIASLSRLHPDMRLHAVSAQTLQGFLAFCIFNNTSGSTLPNEAVVLLQTKCCAISSVPQELNQTQIAKNLHLLSYFGLNVPIFWVRFSEFNLMSVHLSQIKFTCINPSQHI